ncbi:MAG: TetR/AcrR family transcriptional regulator [Limisphaerales bacterium]
MNRDSQNRPKPPGRREREKAHRRQAILTAAEQVFAIHGFETATIEQIAQKAEYAAGTIYLYFKDKNALYAALMANKLSAMVDQVEKAAQEAAPAGPVDKLRNAIQAQFEFHDANREFFEVLMRHHKGPPTVGTSDWKLIGQTIKRHHAVIVDLIARLQRQKMIRRGDSADYAAALLGIVIHLTRNSMKSGKSPLAAKTDFVFQLFMTGAQRV